MSACKIKKYLSLFLIQRSRKEPNTVLRHLKHFSWTRNFLKAETSFYPRIVGLFHYSRKVWKLRGIVETPYVTHESYKLQSHLIKKIQTFISYTNLVRRIHFLCCTRLVQHLQSRNGTVPKWLSRSNSHSEPEKIRRSSRKNGWGWGRVRHEVSSRLSAQFCFARKFMSDFMTIRIYDFIATEQMMCSHNYCIPFELIFVTQSGIV